MPSQSSSKTQHLPSLSNIPPGYTSVTLGDGKQVIVPTVLIPDVHYAFAAYQQKQEKKIVNAKPRVSRPISWFRGLGMGGEGMPTTQHQTLIVGMYADHAALNADGQCLCNAGRCSDQPMPIGIYADHAKLCRSSQ